MSSLSEYVEEYSWCLLCPCGGSFLCTHILIETCAPRVEVEWIYDPVPVLLGACLHQSGRLVCFVHVVASFWLCEPSLFVVVGVSFANMN